jgi:hypothetical protein
MLNSKESSKWCDYDKERYEMLHATMLRHASMQMV